MTIEREAKKRKRGGRGGISTLTPALFVLDGWGKAICFGGDMGFVVCSYGVPKNTQLYSTCFMEMMKRRKAAKRVKSLRLCHCVLERAG